MWNIIGAVAIGVAGVLLADAIINSISSLINWLRERWSNAVYGKVISNKIRDGDCNYINIGLTDGYGNKLGKETAKVSSDF